MYVLCSSYIPLKQYFGNIAMAPHLMRSGARRLPAASINRKELGKERYIVKTNKPTTRLYYIRVVALFIILLYFLYNKQRCV